MNENTEQEGHRSRLRNKFQQTGYTGFHEYEVIELLLTLCIHRRDVKSLAKNLLREFGSLKGVLDANESELKGIEGMGTITATSLRIIRETANLYLRQSAENKVLLDNSEDLEAFWLARLAPLKHEVFEIAYLDNRFQLVHNGIERVSEGTINRTVVYPRMVLENALKKSASAIVLAHNHPTGFPQPSQQDISLTQSIIEAAKHLNIQVVDHIIVAIDTIFSFRREGLLEQNA